MDTAIRHRPRPLRLRRRDHRPRPPRSATPSPRRASRASCSPSREKRVLHAASRAGCRGGCSPTTSRDRDRRLDRHLRRLRAVGGSSLWLWAASALLVLHWLGDSLDGTLARVRGIGRPATATTSTTSSTPSPPRDRHRPRALALHAAVRRRWSSSSPTSSSRSTSTSRARRSGILDRLRQARPDGGPHPADRAEHGARARPDLHVSAVPHRPHGAGRGRHGARARRCSWRSSPAPAATCAPSRSSSRGPRATLARLSDKAPQGPYHGGETLQEGDQVTIAPDVKSQDVTTEELLERARALRPIFSLRRSRRRSGSTNTSRRTCTSSCRRRASTGCSFRSATAATSSTSRPTCGCHRDRPWLPVDRVVPRPRREPRAAARLLVARAGAGRRSSATATSGPRPSRRRSGRSTRRSTTAGS